MIIIPQYNIPQNLIAIMKAPILVVVKCASIYTVATRSSIFLKDLDAVLG